MSDSTPVDHSSLPSAEAESDRYEKQPMLLVIENYLLDCIGELEEDKLPGMSELVVHLFGGTEDWRATVRHVLDVEDGFDEEVRELWAHNQKVAKDNGKTIHPVQFAKLCADENFSDAFEASDDCEDE